VVQIFLYLFVIHEYIKYANFHNIYIPKIIVKLIEILSKE